MAQNAHLFDTATEKHRDDIGRVLCQLLHVRLSNELKQTRSNPPRWNPHRARHPMLRQYAIQALVLHSPFTNGTDLNRSKNEIFDGKADDYNHRETGKNTWYVEDVAILENVPA